MRWSFKIVRLAGIDVYIHVTFLLLLGYLAYTFYAPRQSLDDALQGLVFILAVFGTVVLHELGHALAARRYGIETQDITLLPIGGVARLARIPEEPVQELVVAAAGPLVNVVIAATLLAGILANGGFSPMTELTSHPAGLGGTFAERMFMVNVWLVVFNLIPAFPMDGGRILRAFLALAIDYAQATHVAALIGQGIAFLFALAGLFGGNLMLVFVALFVWIGAAGEASVAQMRAALAGLPVRKAMLVDFATVSPTVTLKAVADRVMDGYQADFPVVEDGRVVGILRLADLLAGIQAGGLDTLVGGAMRTDFATTSPREALHRALSRLNETGCPVMPVVDDDRLVGLLTAENVGELVMIRRAVRARREQVPAPVGASPADPVHGGN